MSMGLGEERDLVPLGAGFDIMKRGYSRVQVEEHLERLDGELRLLASDRDAAVSQNADLAKQLEQSRSQIDELRGQIERLSLPPTTLEGLSERLQRMLRLAQDEATETKARAESEAGHIRSKAEADANELRQRYESMINDQNQRRTAMEAEHTALIDKTRADAAEAERVATAERARLDAQAEQRRNTVEEDFEIAMAGRRTEAMRALAEQEATSKAEAERRVREATEEATRRRQDSITDANARRQQATDEANRRVREATDEANRRINHAAQRVGALRQLRASVANQLHTARDLLSDANLQLDNAAPVLDPLPEETRPKQGPGPDQQAKPSPLGPPKEQWEPAAVGELEVEPVQRTSTQPKPKPKPQPRGEVDSPTVRTTRPQPSSPR